MAKEIKVKTWKSCEGGLVISYQDMPLLLREKVNKLHNYEYSTLTLFVPDPRGDWIEKWYKEAMDDDEVVFRHHKTVTICSANWGSGDDIAISDVCKGDAYDRKTGIAVAYAKFHGEPIPNFI